MQQAPSAELDRNWYPSSQRRTTDHGYQSSKFKTSGICDRNPYLVNAGDTRFFEHWWDAAGGVGQEPKWTPSTSEPRCSFLPMSSKPARRSRVTLRCLLEDLKLALPPVEIDLGGLERLELVVHPVRRSNRVGRGSSDFAATVQRIAILLVRSWPPLSGRPSIEHHLFRRQFWRYTSKRRRLLGALSVKPTRGLEPRTPSLRVKCSTS